MYGVNWFPWTARKSSNRIETNWTLIYVILIHHRLCKFHLMIHQEEIIHKTIIRELTKKFNFNKWTRYIIRLNRFILIHLIETFNVRVNYVFALILFEHFMILKIRKITWNFACITIYYFNLKIYLLHCKYL